MDNSHLFLRKERAGACDVRKKKRKEKETIIDLIPHFSETNEISENRIV